MRSECQLGSFTSAGIKETTISPWRFCRSVHHELPIDSEAQAEATTARKDIMGKEPQGVGIYIISLRGCFSCCGLCMHKVVVLFLSFSKSPSLLKTEFGCKSYRVFRMSGFAVLQIRSEIRSCSGLSSGRVLAPEYRPELLRALLRAAPGCSGMTEKSL
jgi:hypothetical protein